MSEQLYDCIVIGAGPAGLSASLFLARYRRRVLTFHNSSPRNLYSHGVHGFLGHHGIMPEQLLARGRDEVTLHGGLIVEGCVTKVEKLGAEHFRVSTGDDDKNAGDRNAGDRNARAAVQSFEARRILLATGLRDLTPDCPGFADFYGVTVHHCPDCDGFEVSDKRVAVLSSGEKGVGFTLGLLTWTDKLVLLTDADAEGVSEEHREKLARFNIPVREERVTGLEGDSEKKRLERVVFESGGALECDALFFNLGTKMAGRLHEMLECRLDPECGLVAVDEEQQTSVGGVYAAGDITPHSQLAVVAAAEGAMAAIHIHKSLIPEERRV